MDNDFVQQRQQMTRELQGNAHVEARSDEHTRMIGEEERSA